MAGSYREVIIQQPGKPPVKIVTGGRGGYSRSDWISGGSDSGVPSAAGGGTEAVRQEAIAALAKHQAEQEQARQSALIAEQQQRAAAQLEKVMGAERYAQLQKVITQQAVQDIQQRAARVESGQVTSSQSPYIKELITAENVAQIKAQYLPGELAAAVKSPLEQAREQFKETAENLETQRQLQISEATKMTGVKAAEKVKYNLFLPAKELGSLSKEQLQQYAARTYGGGAIPITPSDISTLAFGGVGLAKSGIVTGVKMALAPIITTTASGLIDLAVPKREGYTPKEMLPQIERGVLFLASSPLTAVSYSSQIFQNLLEQPKQTLEQLGEFMVKSPYEFATITFGARHVEKLTQLSLFGEKPYQTALDLELAKQIEPFTRQSARLFLKTEEGKYVLGKAGGEYISIGGGIEKGRSAWGTIKAELKEEAGLTLKDISDLTFKGKIVFPEETMRIYTAAITDKKLGKIVAGSDISKIITISPENLAIRGVTGQTALQPVARVSLFPFGRIRAYEAGIINYLETGVIPTALAIETKMGVYFLGTQSRSNVPFDVQREFLKQDKLLLAHGTEEPAILRRLSPFEKEAKILKEKTRRGQTEGLYLHPPASLAGKLAAKASYKYQKTNIPIAQIETITGKLFNPDILVTQSLKALRTPKGKQYGYIGLYYLGFKTIHAVENLGLRLGRPKATAYLFKEKPTTPVSITPKTITGAEVELLIEPGAVISSIGRARTASIGLRKVYLQPAKILKPGEISETILAEESEAGRYTYIAPSEIISPFARSIGVSKVSRVSPSVSFSSLIRNSEPSRTITSPSLPGERPYSSTAYYQPPSYVSEISRPTPSYPSYVNRISTPPSITGISERYGWERITPPPVPISELSITRKRRRLLRQALFSVLRKGGTRETRGKYQPFGYGLTLGQAKFLIQEKGRRTLSRAFKVQEAGFREGFGVDVSGEIDPRIFRGYRIKQGRKIALPFGNVIKRTSALLKTPEEKYLIKQARLSSNMFGSMNYGARRKKRRRY